MDEIWRTALKDPQHPLHKATTLVFAQGFNPKMAAKMLAGQKEEVIEYLFNILDEESLFVTSGFGGGHGPVHAVELLGEWKVIDALPRFLSILEVAETDAAIHEQLVLAIENLGEAVIPDVIAMGMLSGLQGFQATLASILGTVAVGNQEAYRWVRSLMETLDEDEMDVDICAAAMVSIDERSAAQDFKVIAQKGGQPKWKRTYLKELAERLNG